MAQFKKVCFLNSNDGSSILAFGEGTSVRLEPGEGLAGIDQFIDKHIGHYLFMCLSYDLKNEVEALTSENKDAIAFPTAIIWRPQLVFIIDENQKKCVQGKPTDDDVQFVEDFMNKTSEESYAKKDFNFQARTPKSTYLDSVEKLKKQIQRGDIYEVNYCHEYISYNTDLKDIKSTYINLNKITKAPFSSFFQFDEFSIFCCSPERFLRKRKQQLLAQPIKGTAKRGFSSEEDKTLMKNLKTDPKERAENIMIVDLMRNDLSKLAEKNSVHVDELCGLYSFETVHQLISSISCTVKAQTSFVDVLRATFPMGSMTGAPKISAMQLIEEHEDFKRGLYSGSIGYMEPNGDFDLNVVIRTMIYNRLKKTLSCAVGGAITIHSDAEREYEECQVKIKKMIDVLTYS